MSDPFMRGGLGFMVDNAPSSHTDDFLVQWQARDEK